MYNLEKSVIIDTETNSLRSPTKIHVICTRTFQDEEREFIQPLENPDVLSAFVAYLSSFETFIGHNFVQYDLAEVLDRLIPNHGIPFDLVLDTLVLSRLLKYDRAGGHSIKAYGESFGIKKEGSEIEQWQELTDDMVRRCHSDTKINLQIVKRYQKYILDPKWQSALSLEHEIASVCAQMSIDGFAFNLSAAKDMEGRLSDLVAPIDAALALAFPPKVVFVREVIPRLTKSGALNMNDFRWFEGDDLTIFTGGPFSLVEYQDFNPGSPPQVVERLNAAGWKPTEKTKGHTDFLKSRVKDPDKAKRYREYGWKVNEDNLKTLPDSAPPAAKDLAKRIILNSRISDLQEWIALAEPEGMVSAIHGSFSPIGAWTHRLSHSKPNLANIPVAKRSPKDTEFEALINDYNDEMRALFQARPGYRLVGTDADGIQMRIFAHYVNDERLIKALVEGKKEDETDIHSLHKRFLGEVCRSRDAAKTFIYAWLLGAGVAKVAEILQCSVSEARNAVENFIQAYPGLRDLKKNKIPYDARRGYFEGLDGRLVTCSSEHLMLAGYLQNGEAIIMKGATIDWQSRLHNLGIPFRLVTWPHDEWQTEIPDDDDIARIVSDTQIQAIRDQRDRLGFRLPLEGTTSIHNGFIGGYTWKDTH